MRHIAQLLRMKNKEAHFMLMPGNMENYESPNCIPVILFFL